MSTSYMCASHWGRYYVCTCITHVCYYDRMKLCYMGKVNTLPVFTYSSPYIRYILGYVTAVISIHSSNSLPPVCRCSTLAVSARPVTLSVPRCPVKYLFQTSSSRRRVPVVASSRCRPDIPVSGRLLMFQSAVVAGGPLVAPLGVPVVPAQMPSGPLLPHAAAVPGTHSPPSPRYRAVPVAVRSRRPLCSRFRLSDDDHQASYSSPPPVSSAARQPGWLPSS